MEIPSGGSLASHVSDLVQSFIVPATCECKKFKQILLHKVGFECPYTLMVSPPLNLYSWNDKVPLAGLSQLPKFWDRKPKATTKMSLMNYQ